MAESAIKLKKVKAFWWLTAVTLGYFAVYYMLIGETQACLGSPIQDHWFHGFWDRYLGCRQVSELGDALAGAFAPVAFLWLAGAVFIQSKELEAQREEMNETQDVMRQQMAVSLQQVEETKASTRLMAEQTAFLRDEAASRKMELANRELDEMLTALQWGLEHLGRLVLYSRKKGSDESVEIEIWPAKVENTALPAMFDELRTRSNQALNILKDKEHSHFFWFRRPDPVLGQIMLLFNSIREHKEKLSVANNMRLTNTRMPFAQESFEVLMKVEALLAERNGHPDAEPKTPAASGDTRDHPSNSLSV